MKLKISFQVDVTILSLSLSLSLVLHIVKEIGEALLTHYIYYCYLLPVSFNILPQDI